MTKQQLDAMTPLEAQDYFEHGYPFVFPENEVMDILDAAMTQALSSLEKAYVQWMVETNNTDIAIEKFIHPAYYYDKENYGKTYLKAKEYLTDLIRKLRRECPYLRLYTSDYLAGLLHSEVQYLRARERKDRFYGPTMDPTKFVGRKSPHDQEMEEIDRLLACLKQIHELKLAVGGFIHDPSDPQSRNLDHGIDRVITRAQELIRKREVDNTR
jgi:hypothetical protein